MGAKSISRELEQRGVSDGGSVIRLQTGSVIEISGTKYICIPEMFASNYGIEKQDQISISADVENGRLILEVEDVNQ